MALSILALAFLIFYEVRNFLAFLIHTYAISKATAKSRYIIMSMYIG